MDPYFDLEPEFMQLYEACKRETMTSVERMHALWAATNHVLKTGISGDIVECGVWRGGSMMMVAKTLLQSRDTKRRLWLYDTYDGMTEPTAVDIQAMSGETARDVLESNPKDNENPFWAFAQRDTVESNMQSTGYPVRNMRFVEGPVEETLPEQAPDIIALLRLDTDWYESTKHELEQLWPRLQSGGILIVDDYGYWKGARKAVDEYFAKIPDAPYLARIDFTGRIAVKR
jgi:O-methyltransferase